MMMQQQHLSILCLIKCPIFLKIGDRTSQSLFIFQSDSLDRAKNSQSRVYFTLNSLSYNILTKLTCCNQTLTLADKST